jgi:RNA-binding protein PNO1
VLDRKDEFRRVAIPSHRLTPLKKEWINIYTPLVEMAGLQVRMNMKRKCVEIKVSGGDRRSRGGSAIPFFPFRLGVVADGFAWSCIQTSKHTQDIGQIQKGADFVKAFALGFDVNVRA